MKVAVVGGGLQGIEVAYLAHKAGYDVLLVDKKRDVPAANLADQFLVCNIVEEKEKFLEGIKGAALILPATEDNDALNALEELNLQINQPILFDWQSYQISSSKEESKRFFTKKGVPKIKDWPEANFPLIIKPSQASGSKGVYKATNLEELNNVLATLDKTPIIEKYLTGPSYSMEVVAYKGKIFPLAVTYLDFDELFDCKRVIYSSDLDNKIEKQLADICTVIACELPLEGIMDLEVIVEQGEVKVLEIDARFPSQTPITVFYGTGLNMVEIMADLYLGNITEVNSPNLGKSVIYEHIKVTDEKIKICGEHIISEVNNLEVIADFFGATEAITNYSSTTGEWVATLIFVADSLAEVFRARNGALTKILNQFSLDKFSDPTIFD
ncbi:3-methylornithine--L-lysine ligase PylC [Natroniella acetigena]|uniref:3-methylornithine--L-lysine ligase PylC n=1 Tax=Natroniella acetigena TaxID=52004 RepID=UPI00200B10BC|nr:3-methylornithine--L-lysine ligase PylC [Natroniella acetigena]MCK8827437.1 3-methylornithine--L-lysine ligase PylC [Natroniella acetigena]